MIHKNDSECVWGHYDGPCKNMPGDTRRMGMKRCMVFECRISKYYNMDEEQLPPYKVSKPK